MSDHSIAALIFAGPFLALALIFSAHETATIITTMRKEKP
jgi:hypothetical protein